MQRMTLAQLEIFTFPRLAPSGPCYIILRVLSFNRVARRPNEFDHSVLGFRFSFGGGFLMMNFNLRLNRAFGRTAAVALVLALQAGTARAEIVLDSWSVIACTDIVQFVATFNCASNLHNPL